MSTLNDLISGLPSGNLGNATVMLLDTSSSVIGYYTQETFGKAAGDYVQTCINDTIMGAIVGGVPGAALGFLSGITTSVLKGVSAEREAQNQKFQSTINNTYQGIMSERSSMTQKGLQLNNLNVNELMQIPHLDKLSMAKARGYKKGYEKTLAEKYPNWDERFNNKSGKELQKLLEVQGQEEGKLDAEKEITQWVAMTSVIRENSISAYPLDDMELIREVERAKYNSIITFEKSKTRMNQKELDAALLKKQQMNYADNPTFWDINNPVESTINTDYETFKHDYYVETYSPKPSNEPLKPFLKKEQDEIERRKQEEEAEKKRQEENKQKEILKQLLLQQQNQTLMLTMLHNIDKNNKNPFIKSQSLRPRQFENQTLVKYLKYPTVVVPDPTLFSGYEN